MSNPRPPYAPTGGSSAGSGRPASGRSRPALVAVGLVVVVLAVVLGVHLSSGRVSDARGVVHLRPPSGWTDETLPSAGTTSDVDAHGYPVAPYRVPDVFVSDADRSLAIYVTGRGSSRPDLVALHRTDVDEACARLLCLGGITPETADLSGFSSATSVFRTAGGEDLFTLTSVAADRYDVLVVGRLPGSDYGRADALLDVVGSITVEA